ncbi:MAG: hypothetical protein IJY57_00405 [Clostridia bacterium]|nr:hypothetical protein [Clostridia bacterium]
MYIRNSELSSYIKRAVKLDCTFKELKATHIQSYRIKWWIDEECVKYDCFNGCLNLTYIENALKAYKENTINKDYLEEWCNFYARYIKGFWFYPENRGKCTDVKDMALEYIRDAVRGYNYEIGSDEWLLEIKKHFDIFFNKRKHDYVFPDQLPVFYTQTPKEERNYKVSNIVRINLKTKTYSYQGKGIDLEVDYDYNYPVRKELIDVIMAGLKAKGYKEVSN